MDTVKKILIISYAFPPSARSGIYRILHFSEYLARRGNYQPFILTVAPEYYEQEDALDKSLLKTINNNIIIFRTGCFQLRELFLNIFGGKPGKTADQKSSFFINDTMARKTPTMGNWQKIKDIFTDELLSFPDRQVGWLPFAVKSGLNIIRQKKIDIIFSTGAPWTSLLVGRILSGLTNVPLVLDYRDPWIDNPFHQSGNSQIYNGFSRFLEKNLVNKASAVVLNTDALRRAFVKKYGKHHKFVSYSNS
ncbi:glycosyltransferase, partial [Candidatus Parcubacteria bacterium]|nr:glycosyltransferase [Candidatus Parcubacteria bacterium]